MSYRMKMILPIVGMLLLIGAVVFAVMGQSLEIKEQLPQSLSDLAAIRLVEIKNADGQTVLSGSFTMTVKDNQEADGEATLASTGVYADAKGKAEVEVSRKKGGSIDKELEVAVRSLSPGTSFNLFVDGQQVASFKTNQRGAAELELTSSPSR